MAKLANVRAATLVGFALSLTAGATGAAAELAVGRASMVLPLADPTDRDRPAIATAVGMSHDGSLIAAGGDDHRIRVWDAHTGAEVALLAGHDDWVRGLRVTPAGDRLASVANDGALRLWDLDAPTNQPIGVRLGGGPLAAVTFHPDGRRLLTVGFRNPLRVHDMTAGLVESTLACPSIDTRCVAVSPNGRWAAAAGRDGRLRVWDLATGEARPDVPADTRRIHAVAFTTDSRAVATAGDGRAIRFWNAETGELLVELPTGGARVRSMLFLNGEQLAVGAVDNSISIWNISSRIASRRLLGHTGTVAALACDARGEVLASASYDTTVRVWRLANPPAEETASLKPDELR